MDRWYVYALAGSPVAPFRHGGRRIHTVDVHGVHVVVDRDDLVDRLTEDTLRRQHAIVEAIAARADAVLPARFGSRIEPGELRRLIEGSRDVIRKALDTVRGCEQMTLRVPALSMPGPAGEPASREAPGTAYLRARQASVALPPPTVLAPLRKAVQDLVRAERMEAGRGVLPAAIFHLIERGRAGDYRARIEQVGITLPGPPPRVSGPWPAFAFTPELL